MLLKLATRNYVCVMCDLSFITEYNESINDDNVTGSTIFFLMAVNAR